MRRNWYLSPRPPDPDGKADIMRPEASDYPGS